MRIFYQWQSFRLVYFFFTHALRDHFLTNVRTFFLLLFLAPPKEKHEIIRVSAAVPDENDDDDDDDGFEDLSVEELASLFLNFKTLDKDTSEQLLAYMKRLEKSDPAKLTEFKQHLQKVKSNK